VARQSAQHAVGVARHVDGERPLHRLGEQLQTLKAHVLPLVRRGRLLPEDAQRGDVLVHRHAAVGDRQLTADAVELVCAPAQADAQRDPPAAQRVERRDLAIEQHRLVERSTIVLVMNRTSRVARATQANFSSGS